MRCARKKGGNESAMLKDNGRPEPTDKLILPLPVNKKHFFKNVCLFKESNIRELGR